MVNIGSALGYLVQSLLIAQPNENVMNLTNTKSCINCFKLNNGEAIPAIGLGTSRIGSTDEEVILAIKNAIEVGYRHIDTADMYKNEKAIGIALEEAFNSGIVKREEMFITTKVWSTNHRKELALQSVRKSLKDLKLDYLDLVLVHWPVTFKVSDELLPRFTNESLIGGDLKTENFELAYQGLEEAVRLGLVRTIGVSNFNIRQLEQILMVGQIVPAINQVESHPFLNQNELLNYCNKNGIKLEAYSPLRRGDKAFFENKKLLEIANKYGRTVAQISLRWQVQRGVIVIPRTSKRHRMIENRNILDFTLSKEDMQMIDSLNTNDRVIWFEHSKHLPEYPFV